ncbi:macro domain-containing protein [Pendulispora albinea]|uniref:Macro domain-containing protein n=1 Tax=Pendulispora albinea TaxID=2741071 RepID=A0ABZ2LZV7_9BACT
MRSIEYVTGDATLPRGAGTKIIAHVCNDVGGWGAGFVLAISRRWPEPEREYRRWHHEREGNDFLLGAVQLVEVAPDTYVANMIGQHGLRHDRSGPPIRYEAIETALEKVADRAKALGASVHMPRIGCGLAGGTWDRIEPILVRTLCAKDVPVTVYDFG